MQHVLPALDLLLEFCVFFATACVRHNDSTCMVKNKDVELDVRTNLTLSHITMTASSVQLFHRCLHLFHDLQYGIVVVGIVDACVYAHNHHRQIWITQGTSEIASMEESGL